MTHKVPRKVFYSLLLVLVWLGFLTEGSHALLNSSAALAGNTLTTGSTGLLLSTAQDPANDLFSTSRPGFLLTGIPGIGDTHYLTLKNTSPSRTALDISVMATAQDLPQDMMLDTGFTFTTVNADGSTVGTPVVLTMTSIMNQNGNLKLAMPADAQQRIKMETMVSPQHSKSGETGTFDLTFTGIQHYAP